MNEQISFLKCQMTSLILTENLNSSFSFISKMLISLAIFNHVFAYVRNTYVKCVFADFML